MTKVYYVTDVEYFEDNWFEVFGENQLKKFTDEKQHDFYKSLDKIEEITPTELITTEKAIEILKEIGYIVKEYEVQ